MLCITSSLLRPLLYAKEQAAMSNLVTEITTACFTYIVKFQYLVEENYFHGGEDRPEDEELVLVADSYKLRINKKIVALTTL